MNRVTRRFHGRGHADIPLAKPQLGDATAILFPVLGLGNTKTNKPSQPTQPPGNGNGNGNKNTPVDPKPGITAALAITSPSPTGSPGGGSGNDSGGSGGGSTGSGGGGSNGGSNNDGSGGSGDGGGTSGSNGGGSSNGGNSGGGGDSNAGSGGTNGGSSGDGGNAGNDGGSTATQATPAGPATSNSSQTRGSTPSSTPSPGDTSFAGNNIPDRHTGIVNVGGSPGAEGISDSVSPGTGTSGTGTSSGPSVSHPSTSVNTLGGGKTGTPGGVIAAAVILSLLFAIAVVVFILRKRSRARHDELAIKWWFTRNRTSQSYGDSEALNVGSSSRRSSFATTLDHSKPITSLADAVIPPPPPMAQIGRPIGTDPTLVLDINADQNRFSIGSADSHNSQFLVVHHRESLQQASLMSCTESFPFPKPPANHSLYSPSREGSRAGSVASPSSVRSITPQSQHIRDPFADSNPFDDRAPASRPPLEVETVRHPFVPQLHDELEVNIGDSVRIIQIYDDGWAFVERMSNGEQGLIPLSCLPSGRTPFLEGSV